MTLSPPPRAADGQIAVIDLPPADVSAVAAALAAADTNATIVSGDTVAIEYRRRGAFTVGTRVRYRGQVTLAPVASGVRATVSLKLVPSSYILAAVLIAVILTVLSLIGNANSPPATATSAVALDPSYRIGRAAGYVMLPLIVAGIGYVLLVRGTTKRLAEIVSALSRMASAPVMPRTGTVPEGVFEQLRKLAELRDQGVLAAGEFDQAKAALLAKIV